MLGPSLPAQVRQPRFRSDQLIRIGSLPKPSSLCRNQMNNGMRKEKKKKSTILCSHRWQQQSAIASAACRAAECEADKQIAELGILKHHSSCSQSQPGHWRESTFAFSHWRFTQARSCCELWPSCFEKHDGGHRSFFYSYTWWFIKRKNSFTLLNYHKSPIWNKK